MPGDMVVNQAMVWADDYDNLYSVVTVGVPISPTPMLYLGIDEWRCQVLFYEGRRLHFIEFSPSKSFETVFSLISSFGETV